VVLAARIAYAAGMRKRGRIGIIAVMFVIAAGALAWRVIDRPHNPVYEGKNLGEWLRNPGFTATNDGTNRVVVMIFPVVDSNAIPYLVSVVESKNGRLHEEYPQIWLKMPPAVRDRMPKPDYSDFDDVRTVAMDVLGKMGTNAEPAVPALVRALKDDKNEDIRFAAATALGLIGTNDQRATAGLVAALKDEDLIVRDTAADSLEQVDPQAATKAGVKKDADETP
jgi:HEAT repeat protein